MGSHKKVATEESDLHEIGTEICIRAGVLRRCENHSHVVIRTQIDANEAFTKAVELVKEKDPLVRGLKIERVIDGVDHALKDHELYSCNHPMHYSER